MAQVQKGTTYTDGAPDNLVTATNLNSHVDDAILLPGAITDQTALTTTATDDTVLVHDQSATALKKVTLANILPTASVTDAKLAATLDLSSKSVTLAAGEISAGELNATLDLSGKSVTVANGEISAAELAGTLDLSGKTLTLPAGLTVTKGTPGTASMPAAGGLATIAHGLGAMPQLYRVCLECTTNDSASGFEDGDEIDLASCSGDSGYPLFAIWADATNVYARRDSGSDFVVNDKNNGGTANVTSASNFQLKAYFWK